MVDVEVLIREVDFSYRDVHSVVAASVVLLHMLLLLAEAASHRQGLLPTDPKS